VQVAEDREQQGELPHDGHHRGHAWYLRFPGIPAVPGNPDVRGCPVVAHLGPGQAGRAGPGIGQPRRGPVQAHDGALAGRRSDRRPPAHVGEPLPDGPSQAQPGLIDGSGIEAGARIPYRHPQAARSGRAHLDPRFPRARVVGHVHQGLAHRVRHRYADRCRDGGWRTHQARCAAQARSASHVDMHVQAPGAHFDRGGLDADEQAAEWPAGHPGRIPGVAQRILHQRDVPPAPAHQAGGLAAAGPGQGGERVQHRVVQQALVLAALGVPGQRDALLAGVPVRSG